MTTYLQLKSRVENDTNRPDFSAEISWAVHNAIRHYEHEPWPWLQDVTTIAVGTGVGWVNAPLDLREATMLLYQEISSDLRYEIHRRDLPTIERIDEKTASVQGNPIIYALYNDRLRIYPAPDSTNNVVLFYTKSLTQTGPLADAASNGWTNIASELIYARAAKVVSLTKIHDSELSQFFGAMESEEYETLRDGLNRRQTKGRANKYYNWPPGVDYTIAEEE